MHLWNIGRHRFDYTAVHPRRLWTSYSPWEPEISHEYNWFRTVFAVIGLKICALWHTKRSMFLSVFG
jgi:hypothetical protein